MRAAYVVVIGAVLLGMISRRMTGFRTLISLCSSVLGDSCAIVSALEDDTMLD